MFLEPLIPYVHIPDLTIIPQDYLGKGVPSVPLSLKPFGTLVAIGVYLGAFLAVRQGKRQGLDEKVLMSFIIWVVGAGFVGGHVLDTVFYFPERIAQDPLSLVKLWEGLSSFGGFIGATVGVFLWKWRHRASVLTYADVVASAFPVGWVFGRSGCSVAHDHPGIHSDLWFAVRYPDGGRFDLGLYEMLLTIPLAVTFLVLARKPRPPGFFIGVMSLAYAPTRFALDFLRVRGIESADARYFGLTPAQWACSALLVGGVYFTWHALGSDAPLWPTPASGPDPESTGDEAGDEG
jgi:phosphatidylglycerol:prolipoprotein diacylglycerol transferase